MKKIGRIIIEQVINTVGRMATNLRGPGQFASSLTVILTLEI